MKQIYSILTCALIILSAWVALAFPNRLEPGLWSIKSEVNVVGTKINPHELMMKGMDKMTPEMKAKFQKTMEGSSLLPSKDGIRICLTKESLSSNENFLKNNRTECQSKITKQDTKTVAGTFKCSDSNVEGSFEYSMVNSKKYKGSMSSTTGDGQKVMTTHEGEFVAKDCGTVKPLKL